MMELFKNFHQIKNSYGRANLEANKNNALTLNPNVNHYIKSIPAKQVLHF